MFLANTSVEIVTTDSLYGACLFVYSEIEFHITEGREWEFAVVFRAQWDIRMKPISLIEPISTNNSASALTLCWRVIDILSHIAVVYVVP